MKLQISRVVKDALARFGDPLPSWMDEFLDVVNQFIDQTGKCLKGQVTFTDNIYCKISRIQLTHNTEYIVNPTLAGQSVAPKVLGAFPVLVENTGASQADTDRNVLTGFGMNFKTNGNIGVVAQFSNGASTSAYVTFIILFA